MTKDLFSLDGAPVRRRLLLGATLAAPFVATAPRRAYADKYPSRPIRVILPGPAGGIIDAFALKGLNHRVDVFGGVLENECASLLSEFFARQRAGNP